MAHIAFLIKKHSLEEQPLNKKLCKRMGFFLQIHWDYVYIYHSHVNEMTAIMNRMFLSNTFYTYLNKIQPDSRA